MERDGEGQPIPPMLFIGISGLRKTTTLFNQLHSAPPLNHIIQRVVMLTRSPYDKDVENVDYATFLSTQWTSIIEMQRHFLNMKFEPNEMLMDQVAAIEDELNEDPLQTMIKRLGESPRFAALLDQTPKRKREPKMTGANKKSNVVSIQSASEEESQ